MGLAGVPRVPSKVWQAAQTWVAFSCPLTRSGLAEALVSAAEATAGNRAVRVVRADSIRAGSDFMSWNLGLIRV